jgi:hypothetical protein
MTIAIQDIVDRASYLAYRSEWRQRYAQASQDVRDVRRGMREDVLLRRSTVDEDEHAKIDRRMSSRQAEREDARTVARSLMNALDLAKKRRTKLMENAKKVTEVSA